jgi:hypothetical protein
MNYNLNISYKLKKCITKREIIENGIIDGVRYRFNFKNGLVGSVVKLTFSKNVSELIKYSYGSERDLWECAVMNKNNELVTCGITGDEYVLGDMSEEDVELFLECVKSGNIDTDFKVIKEAAKKYFKKKGEQ